MGDEAIGMVTALHYSAALTSPANTRFRPAFEAKAGKTHPITPRRTYTNGRWIAEAIKAVQGKWEDRESVSSRRSRKSRSPTRRAAPQRLDHVRQSRPEHLCAQWSRKVGGKLQNTVIPHVPKVLAVLDVRTGRVPEDAALQSGLSAV